MLAQGDGQTAEESKERCRKRVRSPHSECEAIGMCISRCGAAESQVDFTEGHQCIETKETYSILRKTLYIPQKVRERKP